MGPAGDVLDNIIISILSHFSKWYNLQLDIVHAVNRHTWRFEVPLKRRSPPDEADSPSQCGQVRNVEVTHETWFTDSSSRDFRVGRIGGPSVVSGSFFPWKNIFQKKQAILK